MGIRPDEAPSPPSNNVKDGIANLWPFSAGAKADWNSALVVA